MEQLTETKTVKAALIRAGYTGVQVGHGTGTAWDWLHIKCNERERQNWQEKYSDIEKIAQQVTGRRGDYGGRINVS